MQHINWKQTMQTLLIFLILFSTAACSSTNALAIEGRSETEETNPDSTERTEGWNEASHSNTAEPNYEVVFPKDKVNQITITITPDDWEAMQANMTELFGTAGSGNTGWGAPAGEDGFWENRPQPDGQEPLGDFEPPEGFQPPEADDRPEGAEPPADFPQPEAGDFPENRPAGGRLDMQGGNFPGGQPGNGRIGNGGFSSENPMWVSATIEFEGEIWTNVGVRYKGNSSLSSGWRSGTLKLPLKLDFDEFEDEYPEIENQRFYGFKQLSLANGFSDDSFLRDAATYQILDEAGLPAAQTAFYEVILDYGEGPVTLGLYTMIEVIDDTVISAYFGNDDGNIYEADGSAASFAASTYDQIEESFEKENNEDAADWSDLEELFNVLHSDQRTSDPAAWRAELESIFDVDSFLEWLAISAVIQHWDTYGSMNHNYYLYHDPDTGQLTWISWDHNMAMSSGMGGGNRRGSGGRSASLDKEEVNENWPLIRFLLDDPVYYDLYLHYLEETIAGPFNPNHMAETYQTMADLIAPYAATDVGTEAFETAVQQLIEHAKQRTDAVNDFLVSIEQ